MRMNYRGKRREEKIRTIKIGVIMLVVMILAILLTYLLEAKNEADTEIWQAEQDKPVIMRMTVATPEPTPTYEHDLKDVMMLAQSTYGEARGVESLTEQSGVMWCELNRVDAEGYACGGDIEFVVTFPNQFQGYDPDNPVIDDHGRDLRELAEDVLTRWKREKDGYTDVGRTLPKEYLWFEGDGEHNYFRNAYEDTGMYWDWSLPSPYEGATE